ncbi:MAG: tyrosine-type recombinase/integrase [Bdellovibrionaceae bacterium]|nr:tyrosine-type recombinase/integrase [Pseudobdellovibrionaceae bacterium]
MNTTSINDNIHNFLKYMMNVRSSSPHTLAAYQTDLEQTFGGRFGDSSGDSSDKSFENASRSQIEISGPPPLTTVEPENTIFLLSLAKAAQTRWSRLSLASRNRKSATIKSFFKWAFQSGILKQDLSLQIQSPRVPQKMPHYISTDEALLIVKSFEDQPQDSHQNSQEELLFLLLYGGGLRVSEACQLTWRQFHLQTRSLRILGKGQKERIVVLPKMVLAKLAHWQTQCKTEFVFGNQPLNRRTAYAWIQRRGQLVGLHAPLHPHALRHSYATHLLTGGVNLRILQELLGHESLIATQKYTHLSLDALARTMESHHPLGAHED